MSLEVNKMFAAVLTAGVVFMVTGVIGDAIVHPRRLETSALAVATPEPAAAPAAAAAPQPIGPLLAAANPDTGRQIAQRACASCHNFAQGGPNGVGPNLWGVVGGPHAHVEGFNYSAALRAKAAEPWDYEALNAFLTRPSAAIPGTRMAYAGMSSINQRADVIAFLRSLATDPVPLP
ncbi:cytochrome c family protein [Roseomonas sp. BU-1]|uniref:Cytochrome c family protein n=2 Tax=Falsiroseomonas selenitidurans TaxID=2716335 RepID=A0ABX1E6W7_9PROT|nr:cytochrome c family protein [Falsiroseomonas selenitidurans]OYW10617.1 MAG: cytochrome c family protein [Rhodospirillales bacterium 12-71-4]